MTVVPFPKPNLGNGAREALIEILDEQAEQADMSHDLLLPDRILASLWVKGFKIVPIEPD